MVTRFILTKELDVLVYNRASIGDANVLYMSLLKAAEIQL